MIERACLKDLEYLESLARIVVSDLHSFGIDQWSNDYPTFDHFYEDFIRNNLYVFKENGEVLGSATIMEENDPPYKTIDNWIKDKSLVIHRIMVNPKTRNKGIASHFVNYTKDLCKKNGYESIKIDTHPDNFKMHNLLKKLRFLEIGYIEVMNRIGYELVVVF